MSPEDAYECICDYIADMDWTNSYYPHTEYFDLCIVAAEKLMERIINSDDNPIDVAEDFRQELEFYAENNWHTRKMFETYANAIDNIIDCYLRDAAVPTSK